MAMPIDRAQALCEVTSKPASLSVRTMSSQYPSASGLSPTVPTQTSNVWPLRPATMESYCSLESLRQAISALIRSCSTRASAASFSRPAARSWAFAAASLAFAASALAVAAVAPASAMRLSASAWTTPDILYPTQVDTKAAVTATVPDTTVTIVAQMKTDCQNCNEKPHIHRPPCELRQHLKAFVCEVITMVPHFGPALRELENYDSNRLICPRRSISSLKPARHFSSVRSIISPQKRQAIWSLPTSSQ
jgi:hypothetical protein